MWPLGLSRQEVSEFLHEYADNLIDILLDAYGMTVDEILMNHLMAEAEDWIGSNRPE